jgi:hypothetical protein
VRVEAGAVVDEFELVGIGQVVARHTRTKTPDGGVTWACMFTVVANSASDLAVVHRLSAPSLAEARRSVRQAAEFLASRAMYAPPSVPSVPSGSSGSSVPSAPSVTPAGPPRRRATDRRAELTAQAPSVPVFDLPSFGLPERPADPQPAPLA